MSIPVQTVYVQACTLRTDGPIYYATREIGRLYETGDYLHNYALTYALGFAQSPYHVDSLSPAYGEQLAAATERGIYVTPGTPYRVSHTISSLKFGAETWHEDTAKKKTGNYPRYGRIKEIAPSSEFIFYVLSPEPIRLPRWVRVGIWLTKCEVMVDAAGYVERHPTTTMQPCHFALNPLDLATEPYNFDIVPMPPNSLIRHAQMSGSWLTGDLSIIRVDEQDTVQTKQLRIPADMQYLQQVPIQP